MTSAVNPVPIEADDPEPPPPPPEQVRGEAGHNVTIDRPAELLPRERGPAVDQFLNIDDIGLTLPTPDVAGALAGVTQLAPLDLDVPLDIEGLLGDITAKLPKLDLTALKAPLDDVLSTAGELAAHVQSTAKAIAGGVHDASSRQQMRTAAAPPLDFRLRTSAGGVDQTFTMTLCTPTPINAAGTNQLTPTTIVSLCPVPLALANVVLVPPPGQPFQLYLSIQRMPGTAAFAASFQAEYDVPNPNGAPLTVRFGLDSGSSAYPNNGIVGAATDYNPVTNAAAEHLTMGWATDGPTGALTIEAVGVGSVGVRANPIPAESGSLALSYVNGELTAQMTRTAAPTAGSNPSVVIAAPVPNADNNASARVTWTSIPQDFTFSIRPDLVDGHVAGLSFDGSQTMAPSPTFAVLMEWFTAGVLSASFDQRRFGSTFSETIKGTLDEDGNLTGADFEASPGVLSTLIVTMYEAGARGAVIELVDIPAANAHMSIAFQGTGVASLGASLRGNPAPSFVGLISHYTALLRGSVSPSPQVTMSMSTGAALSVPVPVGVSPGQQLSVAINGVNPVFAIDAENKSASTGTEGVGGFLIKGNSPASVTAQQIVLDYQADPWTRGHGVLNSLGQEFSFDVNLHGTLSQPSGLDVTDTNIPANPAEYKQFVLSTLVGGVYQPKYSFTIQRSGSNLSGAQPAAPINALIFNPPSSFYTSVDYRARLTANACHQEMEVQGWSTDAATGHISLGAGPLSVVANNPFASGWWMIDAHTTGPPSLTPETCVPDAFSFTMRQNVGGNPNGSVVAQDAGRGRVTLRSFATTTTVNVSTVHDASRTELGANVDGTNSEANPGQQIVLEQFNGATTTLALNMFAGNAGAVVNGTEGTVVVHNVPQDFGLGVQQVKNDGRRHLSVRSYNAAPAPAETLLITGPAGALSPGGQIRFTLRSFDASTQVRVDAPEALNLGSFDVAVHNSNVNANATEVVGIEVRNSGGSPVLAALLARPSGDVSGLAQSSSNGAFVWRNMPQTFDLFLHAELPPASNTTINGAMELSVNTASATPNSSMVFTQPAQRAVLSIQGLGVGQRLELRFNRDLNARTAQVHVAGSLPDGFGNVQLESLWGDHRDAVFSVYRDGPWNAGNGTTRGTNAWIYPAWNQKAFKFDATLKSNEVNLQAVNDVPGQRQYLQQYFYSLAAGSYQPCIWSGIYYPCTAVNMDDMPQSSNLTMVSPTPDCDQLQGVPQIGYAATDSNLRLRVDSLIPCLGGGMAFYGLPAHGVTIDGSLGDFCNEGPALTLRANRNFNESLPYFYMDGWNIHMPMVCGKTQHLSGPPLPPGATVTGYLQARINYYATVALQGEAGLTEINVIPVKDEENNYFGLEGVMTRGNPNSRFSISLGLGVGPWVDSTGALTPSEMGWEWEATGLGILLVDSDYDTFEWPENFVNWGAGWMSSYVWEAFSNNTNRYQFNPTACANTGVVVNPHTTLSYSPTIPFQAPFSKVNNGLTLCGNRVAYYQLNPQNLAFRHCSEMTLWQCPGGSNFGATNEWSYADTGLVGYYSDWVLAAAMKALYNHDPLGLTTLLTTP